MGGIVINKHLFDRCFGDFFLLSNGIVLPFLQHSLKIRLQISRRAFVQQCIALRFQRSQPVMCRLDLCRDNMYHINFPDVCEVLRQLLDFIFLSGDICLELVGPDTAPLPDPDLYCAVAFQKDQKLGLRPRFQSLPV